MQYIIIFFLLVTLTFAKSSDFSLVIDKPFNEALLDVTQDYDREISAVGFSKSYKTSTKTNNQTYTNAFDYLQSIGNNHGSQIHLVKVNNKAEITLSKSTTLSRFNEAVAVVKTPNNGYFIGGYTLDGELIILKLDSNGNIIFTKLFGTNNYDRMNNLILLSDGGVLAIGSSITSRSQDDNLFETGLGLNDIFLTRFSKDGAKLWSKKFGTALDDRGIDAVEAFDGSIIVLSIASAYQKKDVTLMRITENGNKIWLKHYKTDTSITPYKIIRLRDNSFLISLSVSDDLNKEQIRLVKFDIQQNILADKKINTTYPSALKDIKEYSNGNIIGVGYVNDTYNTDALAMVFSKELNLLFQNHYGDDNYDLFNAVSILHNSQAAVVGLKTQNNLQASNMWIVKLNRDGSMAQKSIKQIDMYQELLRVFKQEIQMHKLIIKENLTIEFIDKELYFNVAQYKLNTKQKSFLQNFSAKLIPLLNSHRDMIETLEINGHTSSEWGGVDFSSKYLKNEKLSMNRAYSTIEYIFKNQNKQTQVWLAKVIKGSGLSYSKKVLTNDNENREKSRRVSFKIILNEQ